MKILYYENDLEEIVTSCEEYIEQLDNVEEKKYYQKELNEVKNDFLQLMNSGIGHDAIGKVLNAFENWGQLCVEVETEY
jgi:hypothetical protein